MKKTSVLMAAILAVATIIAVGLTVLPSSVQEAQANPCSVGTGGESTTIPGSSSADGEESESEPKCISTQMVKGPISRN